MFCEKYESAKRWNFSRLRRQKSPVWPITTDKQTNELVRPQSGIVKPTVCAGKRGWQSLNSFHFASDWFKDLEMLNHKQWYYFHDNGGAFLTLLSFVFCFFFLQVYYLRQGHELYVKEVMATKCYDINPKKQCYYKLRLKVCQCGFFFATSTLEQSLSFPLVLVDQLAYCPVDLYV